MEIKAGDLVVMERRCVYHHDGYVPSLKVTTKKVRAVYPSEYSTDRCFVDFDGIKGRLFIQFYKNPNGNIGGLVESCSGKRIRAWRIVSVNDTEFYR